MSIFFPYFFIIKIWYNGDMGKAEVKKRINKLKKEIHHHRYLYHVLDNQEISDAALDSLKHELYELEQHYPDCITPDSPTQRVGGKPLDKFKKVRHPKPILSIEDIFSFEELQEWEKYMYDYLLKSSSSSSRTFVRDDKKEVSSRTFVRDDK
ncbi:hypothetical protein MYX06_04900, partial [Patescibacteria group bacterium AH-259-L05]|nr:hypothetical protein [Patescibacteria group bacterium AH-259-L05]